MVTERPPRGELPGREFASSDQLDQLDVPPDDRLHLPASSIEAAMKSGQRAAVRKACTEFVAVAADFYKVAQPQLRVLEARPLRVRESGWATELFGDLRSQ